MALWLIIVLAGTISIAAWWYYTKRLDWQLAHVRSQLNKIAKRPQPTTKGKRKILRKIYKLLHTSLNTGNADNAYRAFDLLKLGLGYGLGGIGEPVRLTSTIYLAIKLNQEGAAGHGIDAFRPLLKNMAADEVPGAIEQLGLIAVISLKQRQNFLAARAVEVISMVMMLTQDEAAQRAVMRAYRLIGLIALRRNDDGLIREIQAKIASCLAAQPQNLVLHEYASRVMLVWLHRVVKTGDVNSFEELALYIAQLAEKKVLSEPAIANIIKDCSHLSGMDSLNPYSPIAGAVSLLSLELAVQVRLLDSWRLSLDGAGQAARLAIAQRTLADSFAVIYPIFEIGRRLLSMELNNGFLPDTFRQQALFLLIRECLQLLEFITRQNFTTTVADCIEQIYQDWIIRQTNAGQQKSIQRFCQLIFLYNTRMKRRQKHIPTENNSFNAENVLTPAQREHLKQLGYLA